MNFNPHRALESIPSRDMEAESESTRSNLNATFGEHLERLSRFGAKAKPRGKKIAPGKDFCDAEPDSEEEEDEEDEEEEEEKSEEEDDVDVDELLDGEDEGTSRKKNKR